MYAQHITPGCFNLQEAELLLIGDRSKKKKREGGVKTKRRRVRVVLRTRERDSDECGSGALIVLPWLVVSLLCQASVIYGFLGDSWVTECTHKFNLGEKKDPR